MFPWSEKKDTKYYLKKTGASLKNAVENDSEYHLRQAGSNLEKAVYKGVSSLIDSVLKNPRLSWTALVILLMNPVK